MAALGIILSGGSMIDLDGTLFVQFAIFWLTFAILYVFVFRPMLALLDARSEAIDGTRKEALELESAAAKELASVEHQMRQAKLGAAEERDRMRQEAVRLERSVLDRVRKENQSLLADAEKRLEAEAGRIRTDIKSHIPALARQIATRLLGREVL